MKEPSEWPCVIESREGETIYDFAWYPLMQPSEPASCCYLSTSRDHPIHLWDAFTGQLRASYRAYDHMDELAAAYCVAFSPYGDKIFAGENSKSIDMKMLVHLNVIWLYPSICPFCACSIAES